MVSSPCPLAFPMGWQLLGRRRRLLFRHQPILSHHRMTHSQHIIICLSLLREPVDQNLDRQVNQIEGKPTTLMSVNQPTAPSIWSTVHTIAHWPICHCQSFYFLLWSITEYSTVQRAAGIESVQPFGDKIWVDTGILSLPWPTIGFEPRRSLAPTPLFNDVVFILFSEGVISFLSYDLNNPPHLTCSEVSSLIIQCCSTYDITS